MKNKLFKYLFVLMAAAFAAPACQLRPLEDPEESVEVKVMIEIRAVANITTHIYNKYIPIPELKTEMFRVMFYDPGSGKLISQSFISDISTDSEGHTCLSGSVKISPGTYDLICYSFDMPDTFVRDENDITSMMAYTSNISNSAYASYTSMSKAARENTFYEPDHLIVARDMDLHIAPHTGLLIIETEATTVVDTYYLQVRCEGIQYASSASAILSGMCPSTHFGMALRDEDKPCSVYFEMQKSKDPRIEGSNQDVLCALFNTFGKIYHTKEGEETKAGVVYEDSELAITFNVVSTDGKSYDYNVKMNNIFESEDAIERHWLIIDETIVVPEPTPTPSSGGGFNPLVDDWVEEQGNIVL